MPPDEDTTLELRDYLRVLRRRKWIIIITLVVCLGAAFAMSFTRTPVYSADARILLEDSLVERMFKTIGGTTDPARARANEIQNMGDPAVKAQVAELLGRAPVNAKFTALEGTDVVEIVTSSEDAQLAAQSANAWADTYIATRTADEVAQLQEAQTEILNRSNRIDEQLALIELDIQANPPTTTTDERERDRNRLDAQRDRLAAQYEEFTQTIALAENPSARVLVPASAPKEPENRNPISNLAAGLAVGIVLAIALALLREYLDDRIKQKDDLETASGQTVIGLIPRLPDWKNQDATELISLSKPSSPAAEAYRTVRTSVEFLGLDQPIGSLQVTSAMAGEGKTTTLANLAVTFARVGQRVIVLCCDLRRPRVHEFFGMSNAVGFTSMLLGEAGPSEAIQPIRGDLPLWLVASGPMAPNPAELLASKRAISVIEELDSRCDLLLIDSPPVLPVTDAQVISGLVDGVLLVASGGTSTKRDVRRAVELLHQVDAPLLGSVLNNVQSKHEAVYAYGDRRYYLHADAEPNESDRRNGGKRAKKKSASKPPN